MPSSGLPSSDPLSNPSSSVEKAAEKLSGARNASSSQAPSERQPAPDQTSSIERFLNANDSDAMARPGAGPDAFEQPPSADQPVSGMSDTTADASAEFPGAVEPVGEPARQPPPTQNDPTHINPTAAEPSSRPEPGAHSVGLPEESRNPYREAHPDPVDPPQTEPMGHPPGAGAQPAIPQKRGVFGRKRKESKPWHRDQSDEQPAPPPASAAAMGGQTEMPAKRRGLFGMIWGMVRFLLIGKKRPKKTTATGGQPSQPRGSRLSSRVSAGLTFPQSGVIGRLQSIVVSRIGRIPGLRRLTRTKAEVVAEIERAAAETPAGMAEIAAESRRSAAGSHIQRPLDMSRRVGRSVEIDIEKIRAAGMVTPSGERTHIAEEFRLIKRPLLLNAFEKGPNAIRNGNVIMVASSRSGEGKTFMAVNLAMSIASERDLTVLLIDADVAKPDIPNVLGFDADLGLVDLIADDRIDMSEVIMRTNIENLSIMPAGRPHHLATELLASERMGNLVSELSLRYPERVVIMDSPPALLSSVAGVLALNVGQTLFVVEAERTSQTAVDSAIGLVSACKNINLLLNKSRPLGGGERFGSYQSSYY